MTLLERVLAPLAHLHHRAHIDLVEGRQHGGGVLRLDQALRDRLPAARHAHALLAEIGGWGLGDWGLRSWGLEGYGCVARPLVPCPCPLSPAE